jgi:hypothetical protein
LQVPTQQSASVEQASPLCMQKEDPWHEPPLQRPEQHWAFVVQALPSVAQVVFSAVHFPPVHCWLQQSPFTAQPEPSLAHAGYLQTPPMQSPLQQSVEAAHADPIWKQLPLPVPVKTPGVSPPSPVLVDPLELPDVAASPSVVPCKSLLAVPQAAAHTVARATTTLAAEWASAERRNCDKGRSLIGKRAVHGPFRHGRGRCNALFFGRFALDSERSSRAPRGQCTDQRSRLHDRRRHAHITGVGGSMTPSRGALRDRRSVRRFQPRHGSAASRRLAVSGACACRARSDEQLAER